MIFDATRAKSVKLVQLPADIPGKNCGNCHNYKDGYCNHPEVLMNVSKSMGCKEWNNPKAKPVTKRSKFFSKAAIARLRKLREELAEIFPDD